MIHLTAGGEAGRHLAAIVTPLIIHDLPVTVWWPGEPPFASRAARDLLDDRRPAGRRRLDLERRRPGAAARDGRARRRPTRLAVSDFALVRQSRWREAIASIFDDPDFLPYLRSLRRIAVTYATHDETGAPGSTNLVKPVYHVAWLASRLGLTVVKPLAAAAGSRREPAQGAAGAPGARPAVSRGLAATLSDGRGEVAVVVRPVASHDAGRARRCASSCSPSGAARSCAPTSPPRPRPSTSASGRTASRCSTAHFQAARRGDVDLLAEAIEVGRRDPCRSARCGMAAELVGPSRRTAGRREPAREIVRRRPIRRAAAEAAAAAIASPTPCARRSRARPRRLGDDRRLDPGRASTGRARRRDRARRRAVGATSTSGGATTGSCRATIRCRTSGRSTTSCSGPARGSPGTRTIRTPRPHPGRQRPPVPDRRGDRRQRGPDWCAAAARRGAAGRRAAGGRRLAGVRPHPARARAGRAHPVGLPGLGGVRRRPTGRWRSRHRPTSSRTSSA